MLDKFVSDKRLLSSGNNGNQIATHSPSVLHRQFQFYTGFTHPTIHKPMDKTMEELWRTFFLLGEVATEKGQGSPTRGVERVLGGEDIAPDPTDYYCRWKRATRTFEDLRVQKRLLWCGNN